MSRVTVDADRCTGHGRCYTLAPDVFDADEMATISADMDAEIQTYDPDDGRSYWYKTASGDNRLVRKE